MQTVSEIAFAKTVDTQTVSEFAFAKTVDMPTVFEIDESLLFKIV